MTQYKLVPVEPTQEMIEARESLSMPERWNTASVYKAMLAAAPQPSAEPAEIDYDALIAAAYAANKKWSQGTNGCSAFARGAEWYRQQVIDSHTTPQPSAEPVAFVDGLPEGTTHITKLSATIQSGGRITISTNAFKYQDGELLVYQTDNDNEYPGWRFAKDVFYSWDFPITPIHAPDDTALLRQALSALEQWAGLIEHQYTSTSVGMTDLQCADDNGQKTIATLRERLGETK